MEAGGTEPLPSRLTKEARFAAGGAPVHPPASPDSDRGDEGGDRWDPTVSCPPTPIQFDEAVDISH